MAIPLARTLPAELERALGGVGVPSELRRDVPFDGAVLVVGEAPGQRSAIRSLGEALHWRVISAADATDAAWLATIQRTSLIAVVIDDADAALDAVAAVRRVSSTPLFVHGDLDDHKRTDLLMAGADLVIERRVEADQLKAQIHALLRRAGETWEPTVRFLSSGDIMVDLWSKTCSVADTPVALSPTEFRLLEYLMRHSHQALAAGKIVQRVWGTGYAADLNALRIHVSRLRSKLSRSDGSQPVIRSVRGVGYEFTGNVLEMGDGSDPGIAQHHHLDLVERLLDIGRAIPTTSAVAAAQYLTSALVQSGGCDAAAIFELRGARLHLVAERGNSQQWREAIGTGVPLSSHFAQAHAIATQRPTQVADIQMAARPYTETARILTEDGFHTCLFIPILAEEGTWGGLGLASRSTRPFDPIVTTYCMAVASMFEVVVRTIE